MEPLWALKKFVAPEIVFGQGAVDLAGRYAARLGGRKVMVVTDPGVMKYGWTQRVIDSIEAMGLSYVLFDRINENPRDYEVMEGAKKFRQEGCNGIVAVGGGSPMDCAKGIGIVVANQGGIWDFEGVDRIVDPIPPLVCIPTTAGSSADVSQFAIITDTKRKMKMAIVSKAIVPDVALIDPQTLMTMPPYLTACTGMDALTHAIEAYVSNVHWPLTDIHGITAVGLLAKYLPLAMEEPGNPDYCGQLMLASMEAGLAFSNAILGATHAMAHSLGGLLDLPHGECNALLLEHVVAANFTSCPERYRRIGEAMGFDFNGLSEEETRETLVKGLAAFRRRVGLNRSLGELGVKPEDIRTLAEYAIKDACMVTNPRELNVPEVEKIYEKAF